MFPTASHPEKGSEVEGPGLITRVAEALEAEGLRRGVALLGVGGIEPHNCAQVFSPKGRGGLCGETACDRLDRSGLSSAVIGRFCAVRLCRRGRMGCVRSGRCTKPPTLRPRRAHSYRL